MLRNEGVPDLTGLEERGFWIVQEMAQLRRDQQLMLEKMGHLAETISEVKIAMASKLDKEEFFEKFDQIRGQGEERSRVMVEILRILGASLGAAVSALTGVKLLN